MGTKNTDLKDVTGKMGARNDGVVTTHAERSQTVIRAYGKDSSAVVGSAKAEREETMGGGVNNISHSLGQSNKDND